MDYTRQSLGEDEELVHIGRFHWTYTLGAILNIVFSFALAAGIIIGSIMVQPYLPPFLRTKIPVDGDWLDQVRNLSAAIKILAFMVLTLGILRYAQLMIIKITTEIVVTNKRLIYKRGLVARYVGEMNVDRIEGINVLQGFWGRIFNFGRLMVRGMGVGEVLLPPIEDPIKFRRAIEKARTV
jgi:uncharacterized membrane protein YdbT with pleckstrin-like domain